MLAGEIYDACNKKLITDLNRIKILCWQSCTSYLKTAGTTLTTKNGKILIYYDKLFS